MLFHTHTFWVFFALILSVYWRLGLRGQNRLLLLASSFFYGWWDWRFLPLMWYSVSVDYLIGRRLEHERREPVRKALVALSLTSSLGLLFVFKYLNFFAGEACELIGIFGAHYDVPAWIKSIILPIGISFYTFQTLSYVVDVYRKRTAPVQSWLDYALFCTFFPQLLAGPIERGGFLMPQLLTKRPALSAHGFSEGLYHLITGIFKKVVIADNMAVLVNHIFDLPPEQRTAWEVLLGAYAFAFQIYGDFSGYSSMAQGIAKWMGFELSWNFKNPYLATSPQIFWQRWHITLSTWLRDYLFMPLMRVKWLQGMIKVYAVTLFVQLASGVWHGANWTFLIWGLLHGFYLCLQLWLTRKGWFSEPSPASSLANRLPWILGTFHLMCVGMILFRAETIGQAGDFFLAFGSRWGFSTLAAYGFAQLVLFAGPLMAFECWLEVKKDPLSLLTAPWQARAAVYGIMLFMIWFLPPENTNEFIYFQF